MGGYADGWNRDTVLISIAKTAGADMAFVAMVDTVDVSGGEKDMESVAALAGNRYVKFSPMTDITITFEGYALQAGTIGSTQAADATGFFDLLNGGPASDTTQPVSITTDTLRQKYRVAVLWTDDTTATDATAAVTTTTYNAHRFVLSDCYCTSVIPSFTDGILKFTVTFKGPPLDSGASANYRWESCDSTAALTAMSSYTVSNKF